MNTTTTPTNTKREIEEKIIKLEMSVLLVALLQLDPLPLPESHGYLTIGKGDLSRWELIKRIMIDAQLMTCSKGHALHLTDKGRDFAKRIQTALDASKQANEPHRPKDGDGYREECRARLADAQPLTH